MLSRNALLPDPPPASAIDALPVAAWTSDVTQLCNHFNKAWLDLTGRPLEKEVGTGWAEGVHPDDLAQCLATYQTAFEAREPFRMEYRLRRAGGEYCWLQDHGAPFYGTDGVFRGYVGVCTDVTSHKKTEEGLRHSEARQRAILDALPDLVFVQDARGTFLNCHAPSKETLILPPEQFLGRSMYEVLPPELVRLIDGAFKTIAATRGPQVIEYTVPIRGTPRYFEARIVLCATGEFVSITRDITDRKTADEALRLSENRLRTIYNNSTDAIFIHDLDGTVTDVNDKVLSMYGVTRERALRLSIVEDYSAPDNPKHEMPEIWASVVAGNARTFEWKAKRPNDGSTFDVEVSLIRTVLGESKPAILANVRDITARKRAEDEHVRRIQEEIARTAAEQSVSDLREERDLRERLVSLITHDLRSPLSAATTAAELIRQQPGDTSRSQRLAAKIVSTLGKADQMIRDLLDASRIRAGEKLPLEIRPCDLRAVVAGSLDELSTIHGDRFVLEGEAIEGRWDPRALGRVVENLCSNAIKYGTPARPVTLSLRRAGSRVRLSIHNEGEALTPDQLEVIFIPFRRVSSQQTGWGIGLTVVKGIAEAHGGAVFAESAKGKGTTFLVELPLDSLSVGAV